MSFLVNRLKVVAVEVLDAIEELKLRTGQPLARFELQAHKLKGTQRVRSLEEPIVLGMDFADKLRPGCIHGKSFCRSNGEDRSSPSAGASPPAGDFGTRPSPADKIPN